MRSEVVPRVLSRLAAPPHADEPQPVDSDEDSKESDVDEDVVDEEAGAEAEGVPAADRSWRASMNWGNDLGDKPSARAYFERFFPVGMLGSIVTATGDNMRQGRKKPDRAELLQLFGYIMAIRFEEILGALRLCNYTQDDRTAGGGCRCASSWAPSTTSWAHASRPASTSGVDESMSAWKGLDAKADDGMAHVQKIARKPKGVGAEIMGVSDVETGILMQIELVEGRHSKRAKLYDKDYPKGTGAINGHYFMGVVKTAHSGFPMKHPGPRRRRDGRGDATTLTTPTRPRRRVAALMWFDVGKSKSTGKATGQRKPLCVNHCYAGAGSIDRHNHLRQGRHSLALELAWDTACWWHRVFATLLGMCVVNAYLAYCHWHPDGEDMGLKAFTQAVALHLLRGGDEAPRAAPPRPQTEGRAKSWNRCIVQGPKRLELTEST
ncbi:hypothetical protein SO694_00062112 [Aureococcus anophagefferens]|uniref:PiggyBac transposable element-derived protein domain-containing protein n=1 Tax=Aureococcus anophagefferens TaxID=44056 RepID=A0ABR1FR66_AURAN